jgi:hypothetical protein
VERPPTALSGDDRWFARAFDPTGRFLRHLDVTSAS